MCSQQYCLMYFDYQQSFSVRLLPLVSESHVGLKWCLVPATTQQGMLQ